MVVIAKNNLSHENISKQFSEHSIDRVYSLLVWGKLRPQSGIIETFIARSSKNRQLMDVSFTKGKRAKTNPIWHIASECLHSRRSTCASDRYNTARSFA